MNYPKEQNPYLVVEEFEQRIAKWAGSKYAVAVESGTAAIFLSLQYRKEYLGELGDVWIPKYTYPSVPCSIIHAGGKVRFKDFDWEGEYQIGNLQIWDSALRFKKGMYHGGFQCLSFHIKKHLPIGRGGMILTSDEEASKWLRKARFDGREPVPLLEDNFTMLGWNMYMEPAQAARGIQLFEVLRNKNLPDLKVEEQGYPDLSTFTIYGNNGIISKEH
jgi:dTDP-4-amino-4,6-dideoxygalactose transaminase